jgi:hypothetical protein
MHLLPFHSTSRDNRRQLRLARNLHLVKTRRPTGRSRHHHYHLHSFRVHQRPRYHPKHLRARPRGASRLRHLRSPHLLISPRVQRLVNGHACQAPSIHIPTQLISHNNAQTVRAQKAPVTLTHTIPFHHLRLRRDSPRQLQMVNCQDPNQSFRLGRSLHSKNNIDIVSRVGLLNRHEHIIAGRVTRCVFVYSLLVVDKKGS